MIGHLFLYMGEWRVIVSQPRARVFNLAPYFAESPQEALKSLRGRALEVAGVKLLRLADTDREQWGIAVVRAKHQDIAAVSVHPSAGRRQELRPGA